MAEIQTNKQSVNTWDPLKHKVFRALWIAALVSNIGTWMQDIAGAWLMTSLSPTPLMVSLVQAAASLPMFLLLLPSGALADLVNRRRLLFASQSWMLLIAMALSALTYFSLMTAWALLLCIFLLGIGSAFTSPAWQAMIPDIVSENQLQAAISLGSVGMNLARAIGPALAGLLISALGPAFVFLLNAISFLGVVLVLFRMPNPPVKENLQDERILGAIQAGLRYTRFSPDLHAVLIRSAAFFIGASALWAVFPLYVRQDLHLNALHYGLLIGFLGVGAVLGATLLPQMHDKFSSRTTISFAIFIFSGFFIILAILKNFYILCLVMFLAGTAWVTLLASFNVGIQKVLPPWVRARGLSVYQMVFFALFAFGSIIWGAVANAIGMSYTFLIAGGSLLVGHLFVRKYPLVYSETLNLSPSKHWPVPQIADEPQPKQGPVLVTVTYRISPESASDFKNAIKELGMSRRRDGAYQWGLFNDLAEPQVYIESFMVQSWAEHMRQHERVTELDRTIEEKVRSFHKGNHPPRVHHFLAHTFTRNGRNAESSANLVKVSTEHN